MKAAIILAASLMLAAPARALESASDADGELNPQQFDADKDRYRRFGY